MTEYVKFPFWVVYIANGLIVTGLILLYKPASGEAALWGALCILCAVLMALIVNRRTPNYTALAEDGEPESLTA